MPACSLALARGGEGQRGLKSTHQKLTISSALAHFLGRPEFIHKKKERYQTSGATPGPISSEAANLRTKNTQIRPNESIPGLGTVIPGLMA